jgi:hypothetical protein
MRGVPVSVRGAPSPALPFRLPTVLAMTSRLYAATAATLTCDPGDKNIRRTKGRTRVGCCRSCGAKSEMSA